MAEEMQKEIKETVEDALDFSGIVNYETKIKGYGVFKLTLPTPLEKIQITRSMTEYLGNTAKIMNDVDYNYVRSLYELNAIIVLPEDFPYPSLLECRDEELLIDLMVWYKTDCEQKYQDEVKKKKLK